MTRHVLSSPACSSSSCNSSTSSIDIALSRSGRLIVRTVTPASGRSTSTREPTSAALQAGAPPPESRLPDMTEETPTGAAIEDYFVEDHTFAPPEDFKARSLATSPFLYDEADEDYQGF